MSLEISEIAIRMAVGDPGALPGPKPGEQDRPGPQGGGAGMTPQQMDALVQNCTEQVLRTLRMLGER